MAPGLLESPVRHAGCCSVLPIESDILQSGANRLPAIEVKEKLVAMKDATEAIVEVFDTVNENSCASAEVATAGDLAGDVHQQLSSRDPFRPFPETE